MPLPSKVYQTEVSYAQESLHQRIPIGTYHQNHAIRAFFYSQQQIPASVVGYQTVQLAQITWHVLLV